MNPDMRECQSSNMSVAAGMCQTNNSRGFYINFFFVIHPGPVCIVLYVDVYIYTGKNDQLLQCTNLFDRSTQYETIINFQSLVNDLPVQFF